MGTVVRIARLGLFGIVALAVSWGCGSGGGSGGGQPRQTADQAAPGAPKPAGKGEMLGRPISLANGNQAIMVTNTTDGLGTFNVKATFKTGETVASVGTGSVQALPPGEKRVAVLTMNPSLTIQSNIVVVMEVSWSNQPDDLQKAAVASKMKFGKIGLKPNVGLGVDVTNGDSAAHSFAVQAALLKGGELVGLALGNAEGLAAGETRTVPLQTGGELPEHDEILVNVDKVLS